MERSPAPRHLTPADLPEEAARFAQAQISAGRFASIEAFITAGMNAIEERDEDQLVALRAAGPRADARGSGHRAHARGSTRWSQAS